MRERERRREIQREGKGKEKGREEKYSWVLIHPYKNQQMVEKLIQELQGTQLFKKKCVCVCAWGEGGAEEHMSIGARGASYRRLWAGHLEAPCIQARLWRHLSTHPHFHFNTFSSLTEDWTRTRLLHVTSDKILQKHRVSNSHIGKV